MKLRFIKIETSATKAKASIHKSGKIGFNKEADKLMQLSERNFFKVAIDEDAEVLNTLYLLDTNESENSVKVAKSGEYFYLNLAATLEKLNVDYTKETLLCDIEKSKYEESDLFILKLRTAKGKRNKEKLN